MLKFSQFAPPVSDLAPKSNSDPPGTVGTPFPVLPEHLRMTLVFPAFHKYLFSLSHVPGPGGLIMSKSSFPALVEVTDVVPLFFVFFYFN